MDDVKFLKGLSRMCKSMGANCCNCNIFICNKGDRICAIKDLECIDEHRADMIASTVEQWNNKHPEKTRSDVFKEMFPYGNAFSIHPCDIEDCVDCDDPCECENCKSAYWNAPAPDGFGKGK